MNTNLLVKYKRTKDGEEDTSEKQKEQQNETITKTSYNKRIIENREDGGPVTRSRSKNTSEQIESNKIKTKFDHHSAENIEAIKLIK